MRLDTTFDEDVYGTWDGIPLVGTRGTTRTATAAYPSLQHRWHFFRWCESVIADHLRSISRRVHLAIARVIT